jgi:hypothetical protein
MRVEGRVLQIRAISFQLSFFLRALLGKKRLKQLAAFRFANPGGDVTAMIKRGELQ